MKAPLSFIPAVLFVIWVLTFLGLKSVTLIWWYEVISNPIVLNFSYLIMFIAVFSQLLVLNSKINNFSTTVENNTVKKD